MEFLIDKNSTVPVIKQIQEQIKLSIAMGVLKRGDVLPSIREVEKQTGVNRGQIHRAFLALHRSGLLAPAPGKRIAVAISAAAPDSVNTQCREMTRDILKRVRQAGVSPIAFARYLSRNAQEDEHTSPFIAYVDVDKEIVQRRAEQISRKWNAAVIGLTVEEFKHPQPSCNKLRKVIVNHLSFDSIRSMRRGGKVDIIPIEISYTRQTIAALGKLKSSSVLVLLPKHAAPSAGFIVEHLHKWMKGKDHKVAWMDAGDVKDFNSLLNGSSYDRILVTPGAWNRVPEGSRKHARLLSLQMDFDPEALEIARIRAGVIV